MYAITGITGRVGGTLARALLAAGQSIRAIVRNESKGREWAERGCDIAVAEMEDPSALTAAFAGMVGVFILPPPVFDPSPGYPEAQRAIDSIVVALTAAKRGKVVCLSTIGANATQDNLLSQRTMLETALRDVALPVTFLRPAWFLDNAEWDVPSARETGVIHSFLQPLDKAFPMVAAKDVGQLAAELLQEDWTGHRFVELEGPNRVTPNDLAAAFAHTLGKSVRAEAVPRGSWNELFRSQGMKNPKPRIRMLDGFNEGWIEFQNGGRNVIEGRTTADAVIADLVAGTEEPRK